MSETKRALLTLSGIIVCSGAIVGGVQLREIADRRDPMSTVSMPLNSLVASRDRNTEIPEGDYFYELVQLLKREYVDPVQDEQKLAAGAVRGMINSLGDPNSIYMEKPEFDAYLGARQGRYQGIGADFALNLKGRVNPEALRSKDAGDGSGGAEEALVTMPRIPRLTVVALTPNGPAAQAGVKVGDIVYSVDDHWVVNTDLILKFRQAQKDFEAKKITLAELNKLRNEFRAKTERALLPQKARTKLSTGKDANLNVVWERAGTFRTTTLRTAESLAEPTGTVRDGAIVLRFKPKSPAALKRALVGKSFVTLDLRNNANGDFGIMREALQAVLPSGTYGGFFASQGSRSVPLSIKGGNPNPPRIRMLVDESTRGAAEIFALLLSTYGKASMTGSDTGGDRNLRQIVQLPDGSGYTLVTGEYRVSNVSRKGGKS
jgi:carboxyl-terminal processing protease